MKRTSVLGLFIATCISLVFNLAIAQDKIATVSPISYSLTKAMVNHSPIEVAYLPPKRLPVNRIPSWIRKNASTKFKHYDALVGISAVNSGLDLYPSLRQSNIKIVNIDIAQAIMPSGEKVVLASDAEYFWLNSNNLLVMAGILKRDMSALWPAYTTQFNQNYQKIAAGIRQVNLQLDELLIEKDIAFIVPQNDKLAPFIASLASDVMTEEEALEIGLNFIALFSGKKSSVNAWTIDDLSRFSNTDILERLHSHKAALASALNIP